MWRSAREINDLAKINRVEARAEGRNWREAPEEKDFVRVSGTLVHPAHFPRLRPQHAPARPLPPRTLRKAAPSALPARTRFKASQLLDEDDDDDDDGGRRKAKPPPPPPPMQQAQARPQSSAQMHESASASGVEAITLLFAKLTI